MFCIKCGKEAFHGNFCEKCYVEKKELFRLREARIRYCDSCQNFYTQKERFGVHELERLINGLVIRTGSVDGMKTALLEARPDRIRARIAAEGRVAPSKIPVNDVKEAEIRPRKMKCPNCVRILGSYHEALIQVRGSDKERILRRLEKAVAPDEIAGLREKKEGFDVMVVKKGQAARAVRILREKYAVKESYKLVGEKKGRKVYRNFYAVR